MNGKAAKLIRRIRESLGDTKQAKRSWKQMTHIQRGKLRKQFVREHGRVQELG